MGDSDEKIKSSIITIGKSDLPLSCPRENYMDQSHPKVFLPIEESKNKEIKCPYCSTLYILKNITK
tara:strand:- start:5533 stop:5730 length:198 start_codon:yes stop_codon:yes gene_type:complete